MKAICTLIGVVAVVLAFSGAASANVLYSENFESGFDSGVIVNNNGWTGGIKSLTTAPIPVGDGATSGGLTGKQVLTIVGTEEGFGTGWVAHSLGSLPNVDSSQVTTLEWDAKWNGDDSWMGFGSSAARGDGALAVAWGSTTGAKWCFDAREVLGNGDDIAYLNDGYYFNAKFKIVVNGPAGTLAGYYDVGSGYQQLASWSITPTQIQSLIALETQQDYRVYRGGVGLDNIVLTATPEPSTLALLLAGVTSLLAYAWRKRR